jgi:hypothetical protein
MIANGKVITTEIRDPLGKGMENERNADAIRLVPPSFFGAGPRC